LDKEEKDWKKDYIYKFASLDDNLLSFMCGICSNVPISFLLGFVKFGTSRFERIFFVLSSMAFILSLLFTIEAFKVTIKVISIHKEKEKGKGSVEQEKIFIECISNEKEYSYIQKLLTHIIINGCLLLIVIIMLWVVINFV